TTFGRWDEVLAEPLPPAEMRYPTAMARYARGVAFAAKRDFTRARVELDTVIAIEKKTPADDGFKAPISVAMHALMGEIASRSAKLELAIPHFAEAVRIQHKGL